MHAVHPPVSKPEEPQVENPTSEGVVPEEVLKKEDKPKEVLRDEAKPEVPSPDLEEPKQEVHIWPEASKHHGSNPILSFPKKATLLSDDDKKKVYATTSISVGDRTFEIDTVAEIDGKILFLLAFKLVYYAKGRKVYVTALDILTNEMYSVVGGNWLLKSTIRQPSAQESQISQNIPANAHICQLNLGVSPKSDDQTPAAGDNVRRSNQVVPPLSARVAREQTEKKSLQLESALLAVRAVQKDVTAIKKALQAKNKVPDLEKQIALLKAENKALAQHKAHSKSKSRSRSASSASQSSSPPRRHDHGHHHHEAIHTQQHHPHHRKHNRSASRSHSRSRSPRRSRNRSRRHG